MTRAERRRKYNRDWMRRARANGKCRYQKKGPPREPLATSVSAGEEAELLSADPRLALAEFHRRNLHSHRGYTARLYNVLLYRSRFDGARRGPIRFRKSSRWNRRRA